MTCEPEKLGAFLDGELPEPERREVDSHLLVCSACSEQLEGWRALDARAQTPVEPPNWASVRSNVLARVRASSWRRFAPLGMAASALVAAAASLFYPVSPVTSASIHLAGEPAQMLRSGEAALIAVRDAVPERPREIASLRRAILETEAAERLASCEDRYRDDREIAEAFRLLRTVYLRVSQMQEAPPGWEVREVQNALRNSDVIDRVNNAGNLIASREAR